MPTCAPGQKVRRVRGSKFLTYAWFCWLFKITLGRFSAFGLGSSVESVLISLQSHLALLLVNRISPVTEEEVGEAI